jgi:hypothetical protein
MRPDKLTTLRFTSASRDAIDMLAKLYGGTVQPWETGWEVVTDAPEVPIVLPTDDPLGGTPIYELWTRGGLSRRYDGETAVCPKRISDDEVVMEEVPCVCNADQLAGCKVTVRLSVILPEVPFAGTWRVETHSWNAADELPGMVEAIRSFSERGFVRAFLGIRVQEKMTAGKKSEFIVPYVRVQESVSDVLAGGAGLSAIPAGPPRLAIEGPEMVSAVDAKRALLAAVGGDRDEAVRLWGGRGSAPIERDELTDLLAECDVADGEIVDDGRPFDE